MKNNLLKRFIFCFLSARAIDHRTNPAAQERIASTRAAVLMFVLLPHVTRKIRTEDLHQRLLENEIINLAGK